MHVDYLVRYRNSDEYVRLHNRLLDHGFDGGAHRHITGYEWIEGGSHALIIQDSSGCKRFEHAEIFVAAAYMSGIDRETKQLHRCWTADEFIAMLEEKKQKKSRTFVLLF